MRPSFFYLLAFLLTLCACGKNEMNESMRDYAATADSTSFSNDISNLASASRKRVKSADVRCRVPDVFAATSRLEQLVVRSGGIVVESNLQNESLSHYQLPYTADSVKNVQLYTPVASLTLKVPVEQLDTVVQELTAMAAFIDHRIVKDQDMTLQYLSNALKNEAREQQVVPSKKGTQLDVAAYQDRKADAAVDRRMNNLAILDNVAYSTFTVQLFQPQIADIQLLANPAQLSRAGFGTEMMVAVRSGAETLRNILLFLVQLWPFLLVFAGIWMGYRKQKA
jgi:hypothetical protein